MLELSGKDPRVNQAWALPSKVVLRWEREVNTENQNTCRLHGAGVISDGKAGAREGGQREGLATSSLA